MSESTFNYILRRDQKEGRISNDPPVKTDEFHTPSHQPAPSTTKRLPLHDINQDFKSIKQNLPSFINDQSFSAQTLYDVIIEACEFYSEQIKCNSSHSQFYNNVNLFLDEIKNSCKLLKKQMQEKAEKIKNRLNTVNEEDNNLSYQIPVIMKNLEVLYKTNPDEVECDERIALTDFMIKKLTNAKGRDLGVYNMNIEEEYVTMLPMENEYKGIKGKLVNKELEKVNNLIEYANSAFNMILEKKTSNGFSALEEYYNYMPLLQMDPLDIMRGAKNVAYHNN